MFRSIKIYESVRHNSKLLNLLNKNAFIKPRKPLRNFSSCVQLNGVSTSSVLPLSSHRRQNVTVNYQTSACISTGSHYEKWTDLSCEDLEALLESHDIQLFDVREPKEIDATGKINGSVNIPLGDVKEALQLRDMDFYKRYKVSKPQKHDTNIVFYGLGPIKSSAALELAHKFDYKKARHYTGGYEEWCKMNKDSSKTGQKTTTRSRS